MLLPENLELLDDFQPRFGEGCAAAALAADTPLHQWLVREVVHEIDQIPGGLVADPHRLGSFGNAAQLVNFLQEDDAFLGNDLLP